MKIARIDLKNRLVSVTPESPSDVWQVSKVISAGDLVRAKTWRKPTIYRNGESIQGERRAMVLEIKVEKPAFQKETGILRLTGVIEAGPADVPLGSHHTIEVEPGLLMDVKKLWKTHQIERLKKAAVKRPELLMCMIDRDRADFVGVSETGLKSLGSIGFKKSKEKGGGKEEAKEDWYSEISEWLEGHKQNWIILAGPGFERENFLKWAKEKNKELAGKILLEHASSTGKTGAQEVLKKSGNRILQQTTVAKETGLVEELLKEIKKDGPVVYGRKETEKAVLAGAVKILLVSEQKIDEFEDLMERVEIQKGEIEIISTVHEAGEILLNLGGIGAFLRYRM